MKEPEKVALRVLAVLIERLGGSVTVTAKEMAEVEDRMLVADDDYWAEKLTLHLLPDYVKTGYDAPAKPDGFIERTEAEKAAWDAELAKWMKSPSPLSSGSFNFSGPLAKYTMNPDGSITLDTPLKGDIRISYEVS